MCLCCAGAHVVRVGYDCKYQLYEHDHDEHDLVFDAKDWLAAVNRSYQLKARAHSLAHVSRH